MARVRVELNSAGMQDLLNDPGVGAFLEQRLQSALGTAQSIAPSVTGRYAASLRTWTTNTDRVVARMGSDVDYAMDVEADHGTLARALGTVGASKSQHRFRDSSGRFIKRPTG